MKPNQTSQHALQNGDFDVQHYQVVLLNADNNTGSRCSLQMLVPPSDPPRSSTCSLATLRTAARDRNIMPHEPPSTTFPRERHATQLDAAALLHQLHDQRERERRDREHLPLAVRTVVGSAGAGFVYGTMFGGVVAGVQGMRASPAHERLRGSLHHIKAEVPRTAGRIALVSCMFRTASLALSDIRRRLDHGTSTDTDITTGISIGMPGEPIATVHEDMWNVLIAAPLVGAVLKFRHGPRAAVHSAFTFGSIAAVMVVFHAAELKVHGHSDSNSRQSRSRRVEAREVLEEVAFAQEFDDWEM